MPTIQQEEVGRRVGLLELDAFEKPPALTQVAMDKFSKTWLEPETGKMLD